jgi:hypothetical protein
MTLYFRSDTPSGIVVTDRQEEYGRTSPLPATVQFALLRMPRLNFNN